MTDAPLHAENAKGAEAQAADAPLLPMIREKVRERLSGNDAWRRLPPDERAAIARDTVRAFSYILGGEDGTSRPESVVLAGNTPVAGALAQAAPRLPEGDTAGQRFAQSGAVAAQQGGDALADLVEKVDFPAFVAGLIDGVFNAIVTSSIKQMQAYADLVKNIVKSVDQFMRDNITENNARDYLADRYPDVFEIDIDGDAPKVKVRDNVDAARTPEIADELGLHEAVGGLDDSVAEEKLVPAARRRMAMDRQQMLATMVMMGVNRLVVTNGTIEASCLFELNTTDSVRRRMNQKTTSDWSARRTAFNTYSGGSSRGTGFLGLGGSERRAWFGGGTAENTARFDVTTSRSEDSDAKVQLHARLAGKVNVQFRSDFFPMERMIDALQVDRVRSRSGTGAPAADSQPATPTTRPNPAQPAAPR